MGEDGVYFLSMNCQMLLKYIDHMTDYTSAYYYFTPSGDTQRYIILLEMGEVPTFYLVFQPQNNHS